MTAQPSRHSSDQGRAHGMQSPLLRRLDIVELRVREWERTVDWYEQTLGLRVVHREAHHRYAWFEFPDGGCNLALFGTSATAEGVGNCVPNIRVENLNTAVAELTRRGVTFVQGIKDGEDNENYRTAILLDCEGNEIELYEWTSRRKRRQSS